MRKILLITLILIAFKALMYVSGPEFQTYGFIVVFIIGLFFLVKEIRNKNIKLNFNKILILIVLLAIVLRIIVPFVHSYVPDDFWLMEEGKNFALDGKTYNCEINDFNEKQCYYFKQPGHPIIISGVIMLFGLSSLPLFLLNSAASIICILLVYFLAKKIFSEKTALISAFLLAVSSRFAVTSNHIENIIFALMFGLLSMFLFYEYLDSYNLKAKNSHYLLISATAFFLAAVFTRIEMFSLLLVPIYQYYKTKNHDIGIAILILLAVMILMVMSLKTFDSSSIVINTKFENFGTSITSYIGEAAKTYDFLSNYYKPIFMIGVSLIALWGFIKTKKRELFISIIPLTLFYIFLFSPHVEETILIPFAFAVIYFSDMIGKITNKKTITILAILLVIFSLININVQAKPLKDKLMVLDKMTFSELKPNCTVITERVPLISALEEVQGIQTYKVYSNKNTRARILLNDCVLYFENRYCYENRDIGHALKVDQEYLDSKSRCEYMKKNLVKEELDSFEYEGVKYALYRVK